MKHLASLLLVVALFLGSPALADTSPPTEPSILAVRGRTVLISVPAGFDRITLQQYVVPRGTVRARSQRWRTIATKYPRGVETVITLRVPTLLSKRFLRVFGNKTEPLTGSLLTGFTSFLPDPIEADMTVSGGVNKDVLSFGGATNSVSSVLPNGVADSTQRTVVESDIWKVQGNRMYFFNQFRGLQVFDLTKPAAPALLGTLRLPGSGEEMYLLGSTHAVLLKRATTTLHLDYVFNPGIILIPHRVVTNAAVLADSGSTSVSTNRIAPTPQPNGGETGEIIVADVRAGAPVLVARVSYEGTLAESRMVGSVLYLATNVNRPASDTKASEYGTQITAFDLADPAAPVKRDSIFLGGWANAVAATDHFFLVAKYAATEGSWTHNAIDLIDISSPDGAMKRAGQAIVNGNISSKFQMSIDGDVLTAVTQNWGRPDAGDPNDLTFRWTSFTEVQTFSIKNPDAPVALGNLRLAPGETLRATRFDSDRVYVVTFRQIDPLFVIDLRVPAKPGISGHVEAPGFSTYIEPLGDRLVTIGLVNWQPAVSLFDVANPAAPKLLSQLSLGAEKEWASSEAVWNEKAFKVIPEENLILVPVSGSSAAGEGWFSRVQLLDLFRDKIVKRGVIQHEFSPRRATLVNKCIVAISPSRLVTVDATNRDLPALKADLEIAWSVNRVFNVGRYLVQLGGSVDSNVQGAQKLSVSPADDTDETLSSIELGKLPVRGAAVKDGVLYLAQGESGYYYDDAQDARPAQPLTVSAYDLANLPALRLLGSASVGTRLEYGDLTPLWPSPGILVWAGSGGGANWRGSIWQPAQTGTSMLNGVANVISLPGFWNYRWAYVHTSRLVAFDFTRPQAPKFLSDIKVGGGQPWDLSDPVEANGAVFFSYKFFGDLVPVKNTDVTDADILDTPPSPRAGRHFLLRVDYAEPAAPVIDDTEINLPGELAGLARDGKVLFTIGQNYDLATGTPKRGESALQASGFDGKAAHLLDTLPLASRNSPVSIQGETVFTLDAQPAWLWNWDWNWVPVLELRSNVRAAGDFAPNRFWGGGSTENPKKSLLSEWQLDGAGKFSKVGEAPVEHDMSLFVFGKLVVTQGDRTLHLFDATKLESIGSYTFGGWVWPDLNHADGGLESGLWTPLGAYGVETVAAPAAK